MPYAWIIIIFAWRYIVIITLKFHTNLLTKNTHIVRQLNIKPRKICYWQHCFNPDHRSQWRWQRWPLRSEVFFCLELNKICLERDFTSCLTTVALCHTMLNLVNTHVTIPVYIVIFKPLTDINIENVSLRGNIYSVNKRRFNRFTKNSFVNMQLLIKL